MSMMTHLEMFASMEKSQKEAKRLAARVAELAEKLTTSRWQEQIHADNCAKAEAENVRLRELLLEAQSGGDAFRAPQDWWARVALAGPAPEGKENKE